MEHKKGKDMLAYYDYLSQHLLHPEGVAILVLAGFLIMVITVIAGEMHGKILVGNKRN